MPRKNHDERLKAIAEEIETLRKEQRRAIRAAGRAGMPVRTIAKNSKTSSTTIHRVLTDSGKTSVRNVQA